MVAYCFGAGEDITFDMELWNRGLFVRTADPTPRAISHVQCTAPNDERFKFLPTALWSTNTSLRLFEPADPTHVSFSALNIQNTLGFFDADAMSLDSFLDHFGDRSVDIVKMDIEGAELPVLLSWTAEMILPQVLAVEFDKPWPYGPLIKTIHHVQKLGYRPVKSEGLTVLFVSSNH